MGPFVHTQKSHAGRANCGSNAMELIVRNWRVKLPGRWSVTAVLYSSQKRT